MRGGQSSAGVHRCMLIPARKVAPTFLLLSLYVKTIKNFCKVVPIEKSYIFGITGYFDKL